MTSALWLRDNCPCPQCLHSSSRERLVMIADPGDGPHQPAPMSAGPDPAHVDPHVVALRGSSVAVPTLHHADLATDAGVDRWLTTLIETGVVIVRDAPTVGGEVARLAERIGYALPTNFGTMFNVESKPLPNSNAYTSLGLELHTDLPFYASPPDYQFLHALRADATGGDSTLVDGVAVAEMLRERDPDAFALLASWPVPFRFHDDTDDLRHVAPVLELVDGVVTRVRFNNAVRDVDWAAQGDGGDEFYAAYLTYWQSLRDHHVTVRLAAGDVLCFDNRRILHGRTAFDPTSGSRHLQGCYVADDMVRSRLRAVRRGSVVLSAVGAVP